MSFPSYRSFKPSGIPWVADVPEHWEVKPFYSTASRRNESNVGMINDNLLSLSYGRIVPKDIKAADGLLPESFETYQVVRPGDIVFRPTDLQNDWRSLRSAIVEETGIITSAYIAFAPFDSASRFLHYLFRAYDVSKVFYSMGGGLRQSLKYEDLKRLPVLMPSLPEQGAIAAFLDSETAKIDELVAEQRRLMELLKEKRQAVISHAVTRGLNPAAPLKSSGIEWLGDVPEHWEVKRLKNISPEITVGIVVEPSKHYCEEGVPALRSLNVRPGAISVENLVFISPESNELLSKSKLRAGDLVAVRSGQPGTTAVIPRGLDGCNCIDLIIIRKPVAGCEQFLCWYLASDPAVFQFSEGSGGAIQQHFNIGTAMTLVVCVPPISEQTAITTFLREETAKLDTLTAEAQRAIDLLQERRTALISAAVTGQIDVRALAAPASERLQGEPSVVSSGQ